METATTSRTGIEQCRSFGMIDLHYWPTPNGQKVAIFLEESGRPYEIHPVDLSIRAQFLPKFEKLSPNNRIPAIVDRQTGRAMFESGAILLYLAENTGMFLSADPARRAETIQWLFWQMSGLGPMLGQAAYFVTYADERVPLAIKRYSSEANRLFGVLDKHLRDKEYIADEYSIADMATYPWIKMHDKVGVEICIFPNVKAWFENIGERPAVVRAYEMGEAVRRSELTDEQRIALYRQSE